MNRYKIVNVYKKQEPFHVLVPINRLHCSHHWLVPGKPLLVDIPDSQDIYALPGDVKKLEAKKFISVEKIAEGIEDKHPSEKEAKPSKELEPEVAKLEKAKNKVEVELKEVPQEESKFFDKKDKKDKK